jgi:hypothetical protein
MQNSPEPTTTDIPEQFEKEPETRSGRANGGELDEVSRLKERVAELEKLISSFASKGSARKKASSRKSANRRK